MFSICCASFQQCLEKHLRIHSPQKNQTQQEDIIVSMLDRVTDIWDRADASVFLSLEGVMDPLRPTDDIQVTEDRERRLSTLETAFLVQGQVKVSLTVFYGTSMHRVRNLKMSKSH